MCIKTTYLRSTEVSFNLSEVKFSVVGKRRAASEMTKPGHQHVPMPILLNKLLSNKANVTWRPVARELEMERRSASVIQHQLALLHRHPADVELL